MSIATMPTRIAPKPPVELVSFVKRQVRDASFHCDVDRRAEERRHVLVPVLAQPLDQQYRAIGEPFALITRDVSPNGVGLAHTEKISEGALLALQMSLAGEEVNVVAKVLWWKALGPYYLIGAELVAKLASFPQPR